MENPQKPGFWDLFFGRLIGSCVVGCWIITAIAIIAGLVIFYLASNNPEFVKEFQEEIRNNPDYFK